jgi:hypothetical protein
MSEKKRGLELLFSMEDGEEEELTEEEREKRFWERTEKQSKKTAEECRREQERTDAWRKSEAEKVKRVSERYMGGSIGVEKWLISHL